MKFKSILPFLALSCITGALTGCLIFLFKAAASFVIELSAGIYDTVRETPSMLPMLIAGAALLGLISAIVLRTQPDCRGGGIPAAIAILRGLMPFRWLRSIVSIFLSAMLTYLGGVPLGNEGPSVQMGASVGRGVVRAFAGKHPAWDRYIMTGGACAGFAAATGSPLTGILFAFEEAHRRYTPMIFTAASITVLASSIVTRFLCSVTNTSYTLFSFSTDSILPLRMIWAAVLTGAAAGFCAILFTHAYRRIRRFLRHTLKRVPAAVKVVLVFIIVAVIGFFSEAFVGSGHELVSELFHNRVAWQWMIPLFVIRALLLLCATNSDITGGLFVPTLAFGALIGALCAKIMIGVGILPQEYYSVIVIIGIVSFLSAASRTPVMAIAFALEAFRGLPNLLPIATGVTVAFLIIEALGVASFTDTVVESKAEAAHAGKTAQVVGIHLTVREGSFAVGREIHNILWPPTCAVLSVHREQEPLSGGIAAGDQLHLHYKTYDPEATLRELEALIGSQGEDLSAHMHPADENHHVPEI